LGEFASKVSELCIFQMQHFELSRRVDWLLFKTPKFTGKMIGWIELRKKIQKVNKKIRVYLRKNNLKYRKIPKNPKKFGGLANLY
jgi:hypothetical protein